MSHILSTKTRVLFLALGLVFSLSLTGLILSVKTGGQSKPSMAHDDKDALITRIENSPDLQLRVIENYDTPLRIIEAKAKEISASDYNRLTGKTTGLLNVSSVPEVIVRNTSDKTITSFVLVIRDPKTRSMRSQDFPKLSILPNETFSVKPRHFVSPEKITFVDNSGLTITREKPGMDSVNYWIPFAERSDFFLTVGIVHFDNGDRWMIREEGEIQ